MKRCEAQFLCYLRFLAVLELRKSTPSYVDAHDLAIPGAIPQNGRNLSEMWRNCRVKFNADWYSPG